MTSTPRILLALAALALISPRPSTAADGPKVDPKAQALLDAASASYKALPAYVDHGEFAVKVKVKGKEKSQTLKRPVAFAKPNRIDLAEGDGDVRVVSDGKTLTTKLAGKYQQADAPETLTLESLEDVPISKLFLQGPPGVAARTILAFLTAEAPSKVILENADGAKLEEDRKVDGRVANVLLIDQEEGPDVRLLFDAKSHLLTRLEFVFDPKMFPEGAAVPESVTWTAGEVRTEAAGDKKDRTFAFTPADDAKKVETLADLVRREEEPDPAERWVGKPAPDFTLTVLDGPGKTAKLSKADLAGKVVLIDFWATWCPPCMKELPEIRDLVQAYEKKGGKGVVVIALSQDEGEGEGADGSRKLVEETLAKNKLDLVGKGKVGKVALDPAGEIGKAFEVTGLPTLMLLDAQGIVRAVHVGYDPEIRAVLTKEIDALLDGKAPATPKE